MTPWYSKGLQFTCTKCGKCCTGEPGYVWVSEKEIKEMALFLKISAEKFIQQFTRQVKGKLSLKEHPITYDCIFFRGGMCRVYGSRPKQCRTFPFWPENLKSQKAWKKLASRCEGINHTNAPIIPLSSIKESLKELDD